VERPRFALLVKSRALADARQRVTATLEPPPPQQVPPALAEAMAALPEREGEGGEEEVGSVCTSFF
jgi:hypothetical protein